MPIVAPPRHDVTQISIGDQKVDQRVRGDFPRCSEILSKGQLDCAVDQAVMPGEDHARHTAGAGSGV